MASLEDTTRQQVICEGMRLQLQMLESESSRLDRARHTTSVGGDPIFSAPDGESMYADAEYFDMVVREIQRGYRYVTIAQKSAPTMQSHDLALAYVVQLAVVEQKLRAFDSQWMGFRDSF